VVFWRNGLRSGISTSFFLVHAAVMHDTATARVYLVHPAKSDLVISIRSAQKVFFKQRRSSDQFDQFLEFAVLMVMVTTSLHTTLSLAYAQLLQFWWKLFCCILLESTNVRQRTKAMERFSITIVNQDRKTSLRQGNH
jgi:hypothetical protein